MTRTRGRRKPEALSLEPVHEEAEDLEEDLPRYPIQQSAAFAGSTLALGSLVDLFAHPGPTGLFISGLASYVAWRHGPELCAYLRGKLPADTLTFATGERPDGSSAAADRSASKRERTFWERALGIFPEDNDEDEDDSEDEDEEAAPKGATTDEEAGAPVSEPFDPSTSLFFGLTLRPHINHILSGRIVLLGVSDSGKSNNVAVIVEEIGRFGSPLFYLDTEDEARGLCDRRYLPAPFWVDRATLAPEEAYDFAHKMLSARPPMQTIINLQSYTISEAALLIYWLIRGIRTWEEASPVRLPCEVILDEAAVWLPQDASRSPLSRMLVQDPEGKPDAQGKRRPVSLLDLLERVFFDSLVSRGRKRGMGLILATQRAASLNKNAFGANWTFLMRQTQAAEFRLYREFGIGPEEALSLAQGEAFVLAPGRPLERHQFRRRYSPDGAKTPGLAELQHHQRGAFRPDSQATQRLPEQRAHLPWSGSLSRPLAPASVPQWEEQQNTAAPLYPAQGYSPSPVGSPTSVFERAEPPFTLHPGEAVNSVNRLHRPVNASEPFTGERETFTPSANSAPTGFTAEEEVQVLLAYADLLKAGEKVTRTAIRDRLGWNNKQYSRVIMPVCDKHHIG